MTRDEAFAIWAERCGLDPELPESLQEYERQQQKDREDTLADLHRTKDDQT